MTTDLLPGRRCRFKAVAAFSGGEVSFTVCGAAAVLCIHFPARGRSHPLESLKRHEILHTTIRSCLPVTRSSVFCGQSHSTSCGDAGSFPLAHLQMQRVIRARDVALGIIGLIPAGQRLGFTEIDRENERSGPPGKRVHAGQPDTAGHVLEPSGSRSTGARQLAPRGTRYIVFRWSGPRRRYTLLAVERRTCAAAAAQRHYVSWQP